MGRNQARVPTDRTQAHEKKQGKSLAHQPTTRHDAESPHGTLTFRVRLVLFRVFCCFEFRSERDAS